MSSQGSLGCAHPQCQKDVSPLISFSDRVLVFILDLTFILITILYVSSTLSYLGLLFVTVSDLPRAYGAAELGDGHLRHG